MKIIDATDLIAGRLASRAAKWAMLGEEVNIVNCENAVISGKKQVIFADFKRMKDMGTHGHGPFYPRTSERIIKRFIRGMVPYKETKGELAFKRVMCYTGVPEKLKDAKFETIASANYTKLPRFKYVRIADVVKFLGGSH